MAGKLNFGSPISGFSSHYKPHCPVYPVSGPDGFSALVYTCPLKTDWDGAPTAYGLKRDDADGLKFPLQKNLEPLERWDPRNGWFGSLQNARAKEDKHWVGVVSMNEVEARGTLQRNFPGWGLLKPAEQRSIFHQFLDTRPSLRDVRGKFPIVQLKQMGGLAEGYYVSQCNARTGLTSNDWDQRSYVDASTVHYGARPVLHHVRLGDFGLIINTRTGDGAAFFFGDNGAGTSLGECSGAVKTDIAPAVNAEDKEDFMFIVFPGSGNGSPTFAGLRSEATVMIQLGKLRDTGNEFADHFGRQSPEQSYMLRQSLHDWGLPTPPAFPMRLTGWGK
jgi:hypothetical protein